MVQTAENRLGTPEVLKRRVGGGGAVRPPGFDWGPTQKWENSHFKKFPMRETFRDPHPRLKPPESWATDVTCSNSPRGLSFIACVLVVVFWLNFSE